MQKPTQPQYTGQLTLSWDLFTGFQRLNQLHQAEAERAAAQRAALLRLWREDKIGDDVLIRLEREIDLAEARLARDD